MMGMAAAALLLAACASPPPAAEAPAAGLAATPWTIASSAAPGAPGWQHYKLPGKQPSQFSYVRKDGRHAMACLLYTSPSPRDGLLSRMPSSA